LTLHFASGGRANSLLGDGRLVRGEQGVGWDELRSDPARPVETLMDSNHYAPKVETRLYTRFIEHRNDVLVYTSDPLPDACTVAGFPMLRLHASSDGPDTDWVAALCDVHPDGASILLTRGRLRARFRESLDREVLLEPDRIYPLEIEMGAIGHTFRKGHRIRLSIFGSDFPNFDINPNTGEPIAEAVVGRVARNRVYHSSTLSLPVVQAGAGRVG
jgi:putative CocE/NonD family hydrolase